ncbi:hypothetical protein BEWA_023490 [Theileria equi strain WA]|uniref:Signal peptide containing protein n=1 Tax=Theileria equi strain WA TaxID=1537102 RepID=L0AVD2_THEEQ|nr:hypothetical protein BEWA_023490 [Theileria equi strain WA]AFZ79500.1 hypothetical protein BEWA_023490 [Theileria equi strain WA]|eukprot:XP_004829166.1 hypothetical protein BEWA_023490 [Theileria equi strain WA]
MKVLTVLLTVCLVGLCHCGGDDSKGALKRGVGSQPTPLPPQGVQGKQGNAPAAKGETLPSQKGPVQTNGQSAAQPGQKATPPTQQGQPAKPATPVTQSAGQRVTLDLAHPDRSKVCVDDHYSNGVKTKKYSPKDGYHISSVLDGAKEVWKGESHQKFLSATLSSKGKSSVLLISTNAGIKHFKKDGSSWTSSNEKDYEEKLREMRYTD